MMADQIVITPHRHYMGCEQKDCYSAARWDVTEQVDSPEAEDVNDTAHYCDVHSLVGIAQRMNLQRTMTVTIG